MKTQLLFLFLFIFANTIIMTEVHAQSAGTGDFKITFLRKKSSQMSQQEFVDHYLQTHIPLVSKIPNLRGYVLNFAKSENPAYDVVAELWFDNEADFQAGLQSEAGKAALADGEAIHEGPVPGMSVDEVNYVYPSAPVGEPSKKYKVTYIAQRNPDISWEEYQLIQLKHYAPLVLQFPGLRGYAINFSRQDDPNLSASAVVHVWFDDAEAAGKAFQHPAVQKIGVWQEKMLAESPKNMEVMEYVAIAPPSYKE